MDNEATLLDLNIKWEHEKLAKFGSLKAGRWTDSSYTEERFCTWGSSKAGKEELQAVVAQWRIHIELGKLAAQVLCEYMDSRIHCFDNTQRRHPSRTHQRSNRGLLSELAEWQAVQLAPIREDYTAGRRY